MGWYLGLYSVLWCISNTGTYGYMLFAFITSISIEEALLILLQKK